MKNLGVTLLLVAGAMLLAGCGSVQKAGQVSWPVGFITRQELNEAPFESLQSRYDSARVQEDLTEFISHVRDGAEAVVFLGGWCSDSRFVVPHFLKIADKAGFPAGSVKLYSLDRTKKTPDGVAEQFGIQLVPTIIFLREGGEIGRIEEVPRTTLEQDMLEILAPRRD